MKLAIRNYIFFVCVILILVFPDGHSSIQQTGRIVFMTSEQTTNDVTTKLAQQPDSRNLQRHTKGQEERKNVSEDEEHSKLVEGRQDNKMVGWRERRANEELNRQEDGVVSKAQQQQQQQQKQQQQSQTRKAASEFLRYIDSTSIFSHHCSRGDAIASPRDVTHAPRSDVTPQRHLASRTLSLLFSNFTLKPRSALVAVQRVLQTFLGSCSASPQFSNISSVFSSLVTSLVDPYDVITSATLRLWRGEKELCSYTFVSGASVPDVQCQVLDSAGGDAITAKTSPTTTAPLALLCPPPPSRDVNSDANNCSVTQLMDGVYLGQPEIECVDGTLADWSLPMVTSLTCNANNSRRTA